ncbi:hypothetical protein GCM10011574_17610 [Microbispora bryophytorum]|uniref:Uncharacterized protein n=1 Tax=Microbispora bryophytorum TaxID=1460882 RepID=A0A8H9GWH6_9ACTN|nr:hypothetical protein GCM10011574_17610 [Microbispora bryophytorum]
MPGSDAGGRVASSAGAVDCTTSETCGAGVGSPGAEISTSGSGSEEAEGVLLGLGLFRAEGEGALLGSLRAEGVRRAGGAVARGVPFAAASSRGARLRSDPRDGVVEPAGERSTTGCTCVPGHLIGGSSGPASAPLTSVRVSARTTIAPPTAAAVKIFARRPLWSTKTAARSGRRSSTTHDRT